MHIILILICTMSSVLLYYTNECVMANQESELLGVWLWSAHLPLIRVGFWKSSPGDE